MKVTPFLWFDKSAEEAANFYVSLIPNSKVTEVMRYPGGSGGQPGSVMSANFELDGRPYIAFNGGPHFKLNEAVSMFVSVETQEQIDTLWEKLTADGGAPSRCGWLKDRFGLSWQIIPPILGTLLQDKNPAKAKATMEAMMQMTKIDIKKLKEAHDSV